MSVTKGVDAGRRDDDSSMFDRSRPRLRSRDHGLFSLSIAIVGVGIAAVFPSPVAAQEDTVTVVPGARYEAGAFNRTLFGSKYRDLWTMPIRVPLLRPDTFAGGLTVLQRGGGRQTVSLRLATPDGTQFVFRSVDKDQSGGLHPDLHGTLVSAIIQDQVSSKHPSAAVVVAPLLEAVGVLHVTPHLAVMADHPSLGEFRAEFAGMLAMMEERPDEEDDGPSFEDAERTIGTERLLERLEESSEDRPMPAAFLRARLMDFLIGDWDRHNDQWRWVQRDRDGRRYWDPVPRDRDNAFFHADGLVGRIGKAIRPYTISFDEELPDLYGLTYNSREIDARILPELPRWEWEAVVADVQARLTDEVIADAVRRMPPPHYAASGAEIERKLRSRRDGLAELAAEFYDVLLREVDVRATDEDDLADIARRADGTVTVTLTTDGEPAPYYRRVFHEAETRDLRIFMHGGDDHVLIHGRGAPHMTVRVLGGGSDDHLEDRTEYPSGRTYFYDDRGENVFLTGPLTRVDSSTYDPPARDTVTLNNPPPRRDWGSSRSHFSPTADWRSEIGPIVGGGPTWTEYGFRRTPYAKRTSVDFLYAPYRTRFGLSVEHARVLTGDLGVVTYRASASQIEVSRFHGWGNEAPTGPSDLTRIWSTDFIAAVGLSRRLGEELLLSLEPIVAHHDPEPPEGSPAAVLEATGSAPFTVAGAAVGFAYDLTDSKDYPRRGVRVELHAAEYPFTWGDSIEGFARGGASVFAYLPLPLPLETTLAGRAGVTHVEGEAPPFQYSATIGGGSTLRGHRSDRFVGDTALHAGAELRNRIGRINLLVARAEIGTLVHYDIGRVYAEGHSSNLWHDAWGVGLWAGTLDRTFIGHVMFSQSDERSSLSAGIGVPF